MLFRCGCVSTRREPGDRRTETTRWFSYMGKLILGFENPPWDVLYRVVIGYLIMPVTVHLVGNPPGALQLLAVFLAVLVSLRIIPGVLRRVLPFSHEVKNTWAECRAMAKRYDSYQWRKLFGIGVGLCLYVPRNFQYSAFYLALACIIAGLAGDYVWLKHKRALLSQSSIAIR